MDHALLLNFKTANALLTMPERKEYAFSSVHYNNLNLETYARRMGEMPDGSHQVYALDSDKLDVIIQHPDGPVKVVNVFTYTLCISPMSPRKIWAVVTDIGTTVPVFDPLIALHAEDRAHETMGRTVFHFVDEKAMKEFVRSLISWTKRRHVKC